MLYIENLKDTTRKLVELISEFSKVTEGYKINTQESLAFPYTINEKEKLKNQFHLPLQ